jgi:hypothetical protein
MNLNNNSNNNEGSTNNNNNNNNDDDDVYRKYGFIFTMFFLLIGVIGHFLTIFVFSQKRFR